MQFFKIPLLKSTTDQTVDMTISDNPYQLRVLWNERAGYFSLSVLDLNEAPILSNIKMVKNYPLISPFKDTRLPRGEFYFLDEKNRLGHRPRYDDIGESYNLYYYEPDAVPRAVQVIDRSLPQVGSIWDSGLSTWDDGASLWDQ